MSHIALAEKAAEESMVLLKNDNNTLPINRSTVKKIAVIGANLIYALQETNSQDNARRAAPAVVHLSIANGIGCTMDFTDQRAHRRQRIEPRLLRSGQERRSARRHHRPAGSGITVTAYNTASAAQSAGFDFAVVIAGLTPQDEGEEYTGAGDRTTGGIGSTSHAVNLGLDPKVNGGVQNALISAVAALGKPMVVVLEGGSVIDMPLDRQRARGGHGLVPGHGGRHGARPAAVRRRELQRQAADHLGLQRQPTGRRSRAAAAPPQMDYWVGYRYFDHHERDAAVLVRLRACRTRRFKYALDAPMPLVGCSTVPSNGTIPVTIDVSNTSARGRERDGVRVRPVPGLLGQRTARAAPTRS